VGTESGRRGMVSLEGMEVREKIGTDEPKATKEGNVAYYPPFQSHIVYANASEFRNLDWKRDVDGTVVGPPTVRLDLQVFLQKVVLSSKSSGNGPQSQVSTLTYVWLST